MSFTGEDWPRAIAEWPGKLVLIGLTYLDENEKPREQIQIYGRVSEVAPERGVAVVLQGERDGETYWLPPALESFSVAAPGLYRLRSTGDEVENPDLLSSWTIYPPKPDAS